METTICILLSAEDTAPMMAMTPRRLTRLARAGKVPSIDLGDGELRFSPAALRQWAEQQHPSTTAQRQEATP